MVGHPRSEDITAPEPPSTQTDISMPTDAGVDAPSGSRACDALPDQDICPALGGERCRLEVLRREYAMACTVVAECIEAAVPPNCIARGLGDPRPSVLASTVDAYLVAANAELEASGGQVGCHELWGSTTTGDSPAGEGGACTSR